MDEPLLFISAGDPSGDIATGRVIEALTRSHPRLTCFGLGGERLRALGQEQLAESTDLAVMGFWEVVKHLGFFRDLMTRCVSEVTRRKPAAILLVDYPGFNLRLARRLKPLGIPIIYYISPQVWAWGRQRLAEIQAYVDRMLVILPFEADFYRQHGVACDFVGHFLLEDIPTEYIGSLSPGHGKLALLPGSRPQEVERMLPVMAKAADLLQARNGLKATVAAVRNVSCYDRLLRPYPDIDVITEDARRVVFESDWVITASGTATLETAIIGRPMVVVYKTGFITYQIARRLLKLDSIALVNLVAGKKLVPELIQQQATMVSLAAAIDRYRNSPELCRQTTDELHRLPGFLGGAGASARAAAIIGEYL